MALTTFSPNIRYGFALIINRTQIYSKHYWFSIKNDLNAVSVEEGYPLKQVVE
ncbi:hypothetical protein J2X69_005119 [Algoriphagus sp. 4150]|uniref:hypothetical protein n=1 Tax=Algoriphagus sp. 4150 TaxID=2817756 RepID=UPI0028573A3C|nr:hypothetical protein [Algoriphagus sp. 4150]MDR7132745.1 hypothetical protein [Algoriphagus sp. 4150]